MAEPSRRTSRLSIAGGMLALIGVGVAGFLLGRNTGEPTPVAPAPPPRPSPSSGPAAVLPTVEPPLDRAGLMAAAGEAADAFATGRPLPEGVSALEGRDFELRLPFACPGIDAAPQPGAGALGAAYDPAEKALRIRAEPVRWPPGEWLPAAAEGAGDAAAAESIEGFWIPRPWTTSEACPGAPRPPVGAEQTLAIAQVFAADGSRVGRRDGKAYEAVERVGPDALDLSQGLRLRLRGKLARAPGGRPVICRSPGGARPLCLVSVAFDEVAVENPATGATLATWDVASQAARPPGR